MNRTGIWCVVGLSAALAVSCSRSPGEATLETKTMVGDEDGAPQLITADGCLTASGDRFVLTEMKAEEGNAASYRLVGREEDLRAHVGKRVQISGESEPEQVVNVRQSTEGAPGAPATGTSGTTAQVDTTETTRIEVHDLRVRTIAAATTGEPCTTTR